MLERRKRERERERTIIDGRACITLVVASSFSSSSACVLVLHRGA